MPNKKELDFLKKNQEFVQQMMSERDEDLNKSDEKLTEPVQETNEFPVFPEHELEISSALLKYLKEMNDLIFEKTKEIIRSETKIETLGQRVLELENLCSSCCSGGKEENVNIGNVKFPGVKGGLMPPKGELKFPPKTGSSSNFYRSP